MEGTSSTAVVEPKNKSQDPAAKAKRLKRLLTSPDFAEAVEFERALVKKIHDELKITTDEYLVVTNERNEEKAKEIDGLQLRNDYIEQLLANKAGLAINLVQVYRTGLPLHWEFLRLWTGFELPSSWSNLPCYGVNRHRSILDFMRWPQIGLGAQDLNDIKRPNSFHKNSRM
jgi:hypothetical protein